MSRKHRGTAPKRLLAPQPERDPWKVWQREQQQKEAETWQSKQ